MTRLGIDTGGTFTDFVLWRDGEVRVHKFRPPDLTPSRFSESGLSFCVFSEGSEPFHARGAAVAGSLPGF